MVVAWTEANMLRGKSHALLTTTETEGPRDLAFSNF